MSNQNVAEQLWRAYETTVFRAQTPGGTIEIRIGKTCPELTRTIDDNGSTSWCFITAWNPGTERPDPAENGRRNLALRSDLINAGCEVFDGCGIGEDPSWEPEESFLALGISEEDGIELGRRYGQYAIVVGELGGPAKLIDCRRGRE